MTSIAEHDRPRVVIIGGGVHAAVVADCIRAGGRAELVGYTDVPDHDATTMRRMNVPYLGADDDLADLLASGRVFAAILGLAGLEHAERKRAIVSRLDSIVPRWWTAVHPNATIAESASIGDGTVVFAGAVVNPLAAIGRHAVINTSAIVEHHCEIDDFAVVSPHATLCGCVRVGRGAFIGAGVVVITDVSIGAGSVLGAGAVVIRDVPNSDVVAGNPARPIERRRINQEHPLAAARR